MDVLSGSLPATRTYASRTWVWVGRSDPFDVADGTLTVTFTRGTTRRAAVESRRYAVQEIDASYRGGRLFLFLKADGQPDPREADIYEVHQLNGDPRQTTCTCKAAGCRVESCVHRDAIPALIEAGVFDPPLDAQAMDAAFGRLAGAT